MICTDCGHPLEVCNCGRARFDRKQDLLRIQEEYAFLMCKLAHCIRSWNQLERIYSIDNDHISIDRINRF